MPEVTEELRSYKKAKYPKLLAALMPLGIEPQKEEDKQVLEVWWALTDVAEVDEMGRKYEEAAERKKRKK